MPCGEVLRMTIWRIWRRYWPILGSIRDEDTVMRIMPFDPVPFAERKNGVLNTVRINGERDQDKTSVWIVCSRDNINRKNTQNLTTTTTRLRFHSSHASFNVMQWVVEGHVLRSNVSGVIWCSTVLNGVKTQTPEDTNPTVTPLMI